MTLSKGIPILMFAFVEFIGGGLITAIVSSLIYNEMASLFIISFGLIITTFFCVILVQRAGVELIGGEEKRMISWKKWELSAIASSLAGYGIMFHGLVRFATENARVTSQYYNTTNLSILANPIVNANAESLIGLPFIFVGLELAFVAISKKPYKLPAWVQDALSIRDNKKKEE